jgi:DNA-binding transcriptional LysR family regulator
MSNFQRRLIPSTAALTAFDCVARLGSLSAAAAALDLTPGAISRQIASLEEQLGTILVVRNNKGVNLSQKGEQYAKGVAEVIEKIRLISLEAMAQGTASTLKLAIPPTFGTRWLLPRIPDFVERHPDVTINFSTRIGQFDFGKEELDAAIHVGRPDWPGCDCQLLLKETVVPVCSPEFLQRNPFDGPAALLRIPLLEMASRPQAWRLWFSHFGITERYREGMRFEQFINVSQACRAGLGVALMPSFLIASELESGRLVKALDLPVDSPASYYFVCPIEKANDSSVGRFRSWLFDRVGAFNKSPK